MTIMYPSSACKNTWLGARLKTKRNFSPKFNGRSGRRVNSFEKTIVSESHEMNIGAREETNFSSFRWSLSNGAKRVVRFVGSMRPRKDAELARSHTAFRVLP